MSAEDQFASNSEWASGEGRPVRLYLAPLVPMPMMAGSVAKWVADEHLIWLALTHSDPDTSPGLPEALSLLILDDAASVMNPLAGSPSPPLSPGAGGSLLLRPDGAIVNAKRQQVADWIHNEVSHLSDRLKEEHSHYLSAAYEALDGATNDEFIPIPEESLLYSTDLRARISTRSPPFQGMSPSPEGRKWADLEWWQRLRAEYRENRYLQTLEDDELARRIADAMQNFHAYDEDGRVTPSGKPMMWYWMSRVSEVQEELKLRGRRQAGFEKTTELLSERQLPVEKDPHITKAVSAAESVEEPDEPYYVKYGHGRHIKAAYERGRIRINPAASYDDPSLNQAIRDDELTVEVDVDPAVPALIREQSTGEVFEAVARRTVQKRLESNCYVYCMSAELRVRLFYDFDYDSCLIIRDTDAFEKRVSDAMEEECPGWEMISGEVSYYDPILAHPDQVQVLTFKHFAYTYQREVRFAWLPPEDVQDVAPIDLEVGPLKDVAELIRLSDL